MADFLVIMAAQATADQTDTVLTTIRARGGRLTLRYPPRLLIAQGDSSLVNALRGSAGVDGVYDTVVERADAFALDEAALMAVQAWNLRTSEEFRAAKAARPDEGQPWDFHGAPGGQGDVIPVEDAQAPLAMADLAASAIPTNTSRYLIGTVAVGVIIVDGPPNSAASFTAAERTTVLAEVQEGATQLASLASPSTNVNFLFDVHTVSLNLDPAGGATEAYWRDPAMALLGYAAGSSGMYAYTHDLRMLHWPTIRPGPDWGYIAFFTKYNAPWFAYAALGGPRLVMQYSNDGWGPGQIDRVFAHESGHIFGAMDEYASSGCATGGAWGYLGIPNNNCANNNPGSIDCLMKGNTYNVCQWSSGQLGWRDLDADGTPDPVDLSPGVYRADIGITPGVPFYNNAALWIRNADDGEANQTHQNPRSNIDNYIYAQVRNFGGVQAEVVRVHYYISSYTGTEFVFPNDYTNLIDAPDTPRPTVFALPAGSSAIAKVHLRPAQIPPSTWHPCLLVQVESVQDHPVPPDAHAWESNNLAQKNLVIDYVAPSQTLHLPIVLQNVSALEPVFEVKRTKVPASARVHLQFRDKRITPEIVTRPVVSAIAPRVAQLAGAAAGRMVGPGQSIERGMSLEFLQDTDLTLHAPHEGQDLSLHVVGGSSMRWGNGQTPTTPNGVGERLSPFERPDRVIVPIGVDPITRFKVQLPPHTRKVAGISFTAPADATIGDSYELELVQYNEKGEATGGIVFILHVVSPINALKEYSWRVKVLQDLGARANNDVFNDLAAATSALVDKRISAATSAGSDAAHTQSAFRTRLREAASSGVWGYPVDQLAELSTSLGERSSIAGDVDAISLLLFLAQERLLLAEIG